VYGSSVCISCWENKTAGILIAVIIKPTVMKTCITRITWLLPVLCIAIHSCEQPSQKQNGKTAAAAAVNPATMETKQFPGGSLKVPAGWAFQQAGSCTEMSFISWDPQHPGRQFFLYGTGGIFYLDQRQKQVDDYYVAMGGMRTPLTGKPVIYPSTPDNFIRNFYRFLDLPEVRMGNSRLPELYRVQVVSVVPQYSGMPNTPATAALVRALFTDRLGQNLNEGLFLVTIMPYYLNPNGGPGASLGVAYSFMGITAPFNELDKLLPALSSCMSSFNLDPGYVNNCMQDANARTVSVLRAGKALSQTSDNIMKSWENRNRTEDIISQKRSDAILGRQRLYDPSTKEVYQVDNNFIDTYRLHPDKYNLSNLQTLPADNYQLWTQPLLNGAERIRQVR
jgi:hypothetical protein